MKIAFVNDFTLKEFIGGAQVTNSIIIKKGRELGHEIVEVTPKDFKKDELGISLIDGMLLDDDFDLFILNNIGQFKAEVIEYILDNKKYITFSHDFAFCQYRNARCIHCKQNPCKPAPIFQKLYSNSLLNIFLSPLHLEIHKKFFGETMRDAIYIPSPIEEGKFYPDKNIQQDAYLYAGVLMSHKGVEQILDYADSTNGKIFHFAGKAVNKTILERIKAKHTYLGEIPYEEMPRLLRKYKFLLQNPQWSEPFGRLAIEGLLAGCTLVKFSKSWKTGMESYGKSPTDMIDRCIKSPIKFWNEVKRIKLEKNGNLEQY